MTNDTPPSDGGPEAEAMAFLHELERCMEAVSDGGPEAEALAAAFMRKHVPAVAKAEAPGIARAALKALHDGARKGLPPREAWEEIDEELRRDIRAWLKHEPPKRVEDWFDAPEIEPVLRQAGAKDGFAARGEVCVLAGAGGVGKSYLALGLACAADAARRAGEEYGEHCGVETRAGNAVILSYEDNPKRIANRVLAMETEGRPFLQPFPKALYETRPDRSHNQSPAWRPTWDGVRALAPTLVVIDTGPKALGGENKDSAPVIAFLDAVAAECRTIGCAALVLGHDTKAARDLTSAGNALGAGAIAGSSQWHDTPRAVLHLTKTGPGAKERLLECVKSGYGVDGWGALLAVAYSERSAGKEMAGLRLQQALQPEGVADVRRKMNRAEQVAANVAKPKAKRKAKAAQKHFDTGEGYTV